MGTNAAQAAAQPFRAAGQVAEIRLQALTPDQEQSLAVFLLNGVQIETDTLRMDAESEMIRFASRGADINLMRSDNPFVREISCLHGLTDQPRHPDQLDPVFDEDEDLTMDAIDQLQRSLSP